MVGVVWADNQIGWSIVSSNFIYMMDKSAGREFSTERFFSDVDMFVCSFAVEPTIDVSTSVDIAFSVFSADQIDPSVAI